MTDLTQHSADVQSMPAALHTSRRNVQIGFPAAHDGRHPFPLTPETAALLTEHGYKVVVEEGAGNTIHYSDETYASHGAMTTSRATTLMCDIVVSLNPLTPAEIGTMERNSMLLTLIARNEIKPDEIRALLHRHIHSVDLGSVENQTGCRPFADMLNEIEGRAAMTVAAFMLAHPEHGKGIMLGGVTGVIPCEVVVLGADLGARAAAQSALAMGTIVRMLDNDPYGLREARLTLGPGVVTSTLHPHVLENSLRSADIIIASGLSYPHHIGSDAIGCMKKGAIVMDLSADNRQAFPSLPTVTATDALHPRSGGMWGGRICYTAPGRTVPRTAAMAMSNTLLDILRQIDATTPQHNPIKLPTGLHKATCTLRGKTVDPQCARTVGERPFDINLLLSCS